ncbi:MAG TPA: response regulator [Terriglobales bacterium]|nr:response regulator [Terriglobales bacterium]
MTKRILFVDDEPLVLNGIERSLRTMRKEWQMEFVLGGSEALETMARNPFDVVISDMRMPRMDGAQLLEQVKHRFPQTVRMALSGQSDRDTIFRCIGPTHQYLSKPCDIEEIKQKLTRALALRDVLHHPELKQMVSRMEAVPSLPALLKSLKLLLDCPNPSVSGVSDLIVQDMGMTAKVLQLVNCAFLGTPARVASAKQAVSMVGLDNIKILVHTLGLFSEFTDTLPDPLTHLWCHSLTTARFAQAIARTEKSDDYTIECAFTAGLLHNIGSLILACSSEEHSSLTQEITATASRNNPEAFNNIHPQVGAYLLGLWGLPAEIIEAVAWHHEPSHAKPTQFSPLIAVHVAAHYNQRRQPGQAARKHEGLDESLISHLGLQERLVFWEEACSEIAAERAANA